MENTEQVTDTSQFVEVTNSQPERETTIAEDIKEFNRQLDLAVEEVSAWRSRLANIQEEFAQKISNKTRGMKVE